MLIISNGFASREVPVFCIICTRHENCPFKKYGLHSLNQGLFYFIHVIVNLYGQLELGDIT